jgi:hypothetical protein
MSGFLDTSINERFSIDIFEDLLSKMLNCCERMCCDYKEKDEKLENNERKIQDALYINYLDDDDILEEMGLDNFRFNIEVPENYSGDSFIGRLDFKIYGINSFKKRNEYYSVECKRIDGTGGLNNKYVTEGINRFISIPPKYPLPLKAGAMLGFVVRNVDICSNFDSIHLIQSELLNSECNVSDYSILLSDKMFENYYQFSSGENIKMYHCFWNFSEIIQST